MKFIWDGAVCPFASGFCSAMALSSAMDGSGEVASFLVALAILNAVLAWAAHRLGAEA